MPLGLWIRLSAMMFLQYAVWGIWLPGLGQFMGKDGGIGLSEAEQGWVFTVYGFGAILGPFVVGQLADRYVSAQKVMAACHFLGAFLLMGAAYSTSFWPLFGCLFLYCNLYMPTMGLSNSIAFRALGPAHQSRFAFIRLWGTIGWIAVGLAYGYYLDQRKVEASPLSDLFKIAVVGLPSFRDCLRISAVLSLIYSIYCLVLPDTPPAPAAAPGLTGASKPSPIAEVLGLLQDRSYAVLVTITGLVGIMLAFYFGCETFFLGDVGVPETKVVPAMTIGQGAELALMFLVPVAVQRLGIKATMLLGAAAWAIRFGLSAIGQPTWLMVSTIALHGFAFGFFFIPAQMYVDRTAPPDAKSTAQNFLVFVIYGLGTILGSVLSGYLRGAFKLPGTGATNWSIVWAGPTILTALCIAAFAAMFRESRVAADGAGPAMPGH